VPGHISIRGYYLSHGVCWYICITYVCIHTTRQENLHCFPLFTFRIIGISPYLEKEFLLAPVRRQVPLQKVGTLSVTFFFLSDRIWAFHRTFRQINILFITVGAFTISKAKCSKDMTILRVFLSAIYNICLLQLTFYIIMLTSLTVQSLWPVPFRN
jgi:hypothetical protein